MASTRREVAAPGISRARASCVSMRRWYSGTRVARKSEGVARSASALVGVIVVPGVFIERCEGFFTVTRQQHFDFLLGDAQRGLALARERHTTLESLERLFEWHVTLFESGDQHFEFGE